MKDSSNQLTSSSLLHTVRWGLIAGVVAVSVCMIGLIEAFDARDVISEQLTLGQILLFSAAPVVGFFMARSERNILLKLLYGFISGTLSAVPIGILIWLTRVFDGGVDGDRFVLRDAFLNVSPKLIEIITLGQESVWGGFGRLVLIFAVLGVSGAVFALLPKRLWTALLIGFGWAAMIGTLSEVFIGILLSRLGDDTMDMIFGRTGVNLRPFLIIFAATTLFNLFWRTVGEKGYNNIKQSLPTGARRTVNWVWLALLGLFLLILPSILGVYLSEIFNNVGLYILMGLGLNIAVGLAGLLDLGYVTNFAVGAYLMALLTTTSEYGLENPISFWIALPICVAAAMAAGFIFALPVLKMRGDYLAIATMGFGEIIRILAKSDAFKWLIGGAQGILKIPKAQISGALGGAVETVTTPINNFLAKYGLGILNAENGEVSFGNPPQLYYLIVLSCFLMLFVSYRLNNSRVGRQWMAIREDEDVAAAMGINTTNAKVIAFTLSAASGGLAGAIFAAKLGSIYPSSFQLIISTNVLSLIIVGGIGSIPGVVVGAFALIGVPELLREFAEFRILFYGIALIAMMLIRPEGLWPSDVRRRELRDEEDDAIPIPEN